MAGATKRRVGARIVVVGDVHADWNTELDGRALRLLNPDVVLFVGDFGDENVQVVEEVSKLKMPGVAILKVLGNHDCCYSVHQKTSSKRKWLRVEQQLEALGESHVGYTRKDLPELKLSVIGVRPFSGGGNLIYNKPLVAHLYGVESMQQSAEKIVELASSAPKDHSLIFVGHNGPTGLGSRPDDICGKDFVKDGGDYGDPDLAEALGKIRQQSSKVALVVFGHMHKKLLRLSGDRKMCTFEGKNSNNPGTVYVNGAVVPRCNEAGRNFTVVELAAGSCDVLKVTETWVCVPDDAEARIASETVLFRRQANDKSKKILPLTSTGIRFWGKGEH